MTIPSPCINICVTDPDNDLCLGCGRTTPEITKWSRYSDNEKREVIAISRTRMDTEQLKVFDKAYKKIQERVNRNIKIKKLQNKQD